jgi:ParB family transcriptional regulator, chromosome partitioning protein
VDGGAMSPRSGLGRGLDALLPAEGDIGTSEKGSLLVVPSVSIAPNPKQPRRSFDHRGLEELAASIRELGVLQPLLVREAGDGFELIAGERRLRAARAAGVEDVPVMVVDTDDGGSLERALVENIHREDLNPIEEAAGYRQLLDDGGLSQEDLGRRVGRSRVTITNALRLLELPVALQKMLVDRKLSAGHGRALLGLTNNPFQLRLAQRIAQEGVSVRESEELVRRYQTMSSRSPSTRESTPKPPLATDAQRRLADHLQTRVRVEVGKKRGKIVLDFATLDELERLTAAILGPEPTTMRVTGVEDGP